MSGTSSSAIAWLDVKPRAASVADSRTDTFVLVHAHKFSFHSVVPGARSSRVRQV